MTADELARLARAARAADKKALAATAARDAAIVEAKATMTHQEIADATQLTRGRINQIK